MLRYLGRSLGNANPSNSNYIWVDDNGPIPRCMHAYIIFPWIGRHPAGTYTEICPRVTIAACKSSVANTRNTVVLVMHLLGS